GSFSRAAISPEFSGRLRSSCSIFSAPPRSRAAKRRARVALPSPSSPAKSSVCGMRSRSIMLSSVVWTCAFPMKLSNIELLPDGARYIADGGAAIDHDDPVRLGAGEREISVAYALMEGDALIVDARFRRADALVAALGAFEAGLEIDVD